MSIRHRNRERQTIENELDQKAVRDSVWLAIWMAQRIGWLQIADSLMSVLAHVDARCSE